MWGGAHCTPTLTLEAVASSVFRRPASAEACEAGRMLDPLPTLTVPSCRGLIFLAA